MSDAPISALPEATTPISTDLLAIVTDNATIPVSKKITYSNLVKVSVPVGTILPFAGSTSPSAFLLCSGTAVSRTTYADLFAVTGTAYGVGDGSTTFNLPNLQGRVPVGKSTDTEFDVLGETGGEKTHVLTGAEMPAHTHDFDFSGGGGGVNSLGVSGSLVQGYKATSSTGGNTAHNNLQPYLTINYIIKY